MTSSLQKTMKPQSCKSKGRRLQQRIVRSILEAFPHLSPDDVVSTSMGANGEDVRLSSAARKAVPLSLECKCVERVNVWSCIEQARSNAPSGATPCVILSRNHEKSYAILPWEVLVDLLVRLHRGQDCPPRVLALIRELAAAVEPSA